MVLKGYQLNLKHCSRLADVDEVVDVYEYFKAWENVYLVEEVVNGIPLQSWIAQNYPFGGSEDKRKAIFVRRWILQKK